MLNPQSWLLVNHCTLSITLYTFRLLEKEDTDIHYVFTCKCITAHVKLTVSTDPFIF